MSYLDNNPFNRPTPNFTTNINTFNTYSSNDYLNTASKSPYSYDTNYTPGTKYDSYGGYFGKSAKGSSAEEYKYSRAVEDSPFITGTNPFAMSNVGQQRAYVPSSSYESPYQRPSYESDRREYTYEPRMSSTSGFADPYQQPYFKGDKYEEKFRKSTFEANFELQLGKSRENEADTRYKNSAKEVQLSALLANNPFRKGSLQSNKGASYEQPYKTSEYDDKRRDTYDTTGYKNYTTVDSSPRYESQRNNYELPSNEYQPYPGQKTSTDHNPITSNTDELISAFKSKYNNEKNDLLMWNDNDDQSQKGSRNTFINRMNDVISDVEDDDGIRIKVMDNPFARENNLFAKDKIPMGKAESVRNSQQNYAQDYQRCSSDAGSIRFEDFIDIGGGNNTKQQEQQDTKYDKYIFKKTSIVDADSFQSKHDDLLGSKVSSKASTRQKVYEQFQWSSKGGSRAHAEVDTETRRMVLGENNKLVESLSYDKAACDNDKIEMRGSKARYGQMKESLESQKLQPVMKRSLQRDEGQSTHLQSEVKMEKQMKYSLTGQLKTSLTAEHKSTLSKQQTNPFSIKQSNPFTVQNAKPIISKPEVFKFPKQHFADEQDDDDHQNYQQAQRKRESEYSLKRISEANQSAERESDPNFSKRQSRASLTQKNTEQEIDQKLEKYRYTYQKETEVKCGPQIITQSLAHSQQFAKHAEIKHNNEPMLHDFMDMQMDDSYHEESSFQAAHVNDHNQQLTPTTVIKRNNLKARVVNSLKNDSLNLQSQKDIRIHDQKVENYHSNNGRVENVKKDSPTVEKYEFQALEQFEARYKMKNSGFDFDDDEFGETEKQFGFEDDIDNNRHNNVLIAQYGYDHHQHEQPLQKQSQPKMSQQIEDNNEHSPRRSYISSISSSSNVESHLKDDDYVLPSFNVGVGKMNDKVRSSLNERQRDVVEERNADVGKLSAKRWTGTDGADGADVKPVEINKQKNGEKKVHRVKIYESEGEAEPFRSSGEYAQYTSPFQKPKQKPIPAQTIAPTQLPTKNNPTVRLSFGADNYAYDEAMQRSEVKLFSSSNNEDMDELSQEDLADTVKHVTRQSQRDTNIRVNRYSNSSTTHPPVRDSFEFGTRGSIRQPTQQHAKLNINKQARQQLYNKQHPRTLQLRGSIYHLIELM